ncbi:MAG: O-antigen ligase [Flavobacteriaceae bacterium]|jgi:O-antigen ligase
MIKNLKFKIVKTLFITGTFLFFISLLIPENLRNIPIFIFIFIIFILFINFKIKTTAFHKITIYNTLYFVITAISLFYTDNIDYGLKRIMTMSAILIVPLCFYLVSNMEIIRYDKFLKYFFTCFFISSILFFIGVLIKNNFDGYLNETIFIHTPERLNAGYGRYSIHPIYASIYLSISIIFSIPIYKKLNNKVSKIGLILGALFLIMTLIVLARKGPIIITFLLLLAYLFTSKKKSRNIFFFGLATIIFSIIAYNIPSIKNRFIELFEVLIQKKSVDFGSTEIRLNIIGCSIDAIKNAPFFGYGVGGAESVLQVCYEKKTMIFKGEYYNSHNQFISAWLSSGILGIASLIGLFIFNFKNAIKSKDFIHISILTLFLFMMLIENILERQNGVIIFSFFINFFAFKNISETSDEL